MPSCHSAGHIWDPCPPSEVTPRAPGESSLSCTSSLSQAHIHTHSPSNTTAAFCQRKCPEVPKGPPGSPHSPPKWSSMHSSCQETPLQGQSQPCRLGTLFLCSKQFLVPCNPSAAQNEAVGEKQRGHHLTALQGLPLQEQNKKCFVNLLCGCQTLLLQDSQPCHTPTGNSSMCDALEFIPAAASTELSALAQTHRVFLAHPSALTGHSSSLLHLTQSKLPKRGRPLPFIPFPPVPGQCILKGTAREVTEASLSWSQEGSTPADHQAAPTGFSPPQRYQEQLWSNTKSERSLSTTVCIPKLSAGTLPTNWLTVTIFVSH